MIHNEFRMLQPHMFVLGTKGLCIVIKIECTECFIADGTLFNLFNFQIRIRFRNFEVFSDFFRNWILVLISRLKKKNLKSLRIFYGFFFFYLRKIRSFTDIPMFRKVFHIREISLTCSTFHPGFFNKLFMNSVHMLERHSTSLALWANHQLGISWCVKSVKLVEFAIIKVISNDVFLRKQDFTKWTSWPVVFGIGWVFGSNVWIHGSERDEKLVAILDWTFGSFFRRWLWNCFQ